VWQLVQPRHTTAFISRMSSRSITNVFGWAHDDDVQASFGVTFNAPLSPSAVLRRPSVNGHCANAAREPSTRYVEQSLPRDVGVPVGVSGHCHAA